MTTKDTLHSAHTQRINAGDQKDEYDTLEDRSSLPTLSKSYGPAPETHLDDLEYSQHPPRKPWTNAGEYDHEQYLYHQQAVLQKHQDRPQVPPPSLKKHQDQLNELFMAQEQLDKASKERYWLFEENTLLKYHLHVLQWRMRCAENLWQSPIYRHDPIRRQRRASMPRRDWMMQPQRYFDGDLEWAQTYHPYLA